MISYIIFIASICMSNQCIEVQVYDIPVSNDSEYVRALEQCQRDKQALAEQGVYAYCHTTK